MADNTQQNQILSEREKEMLLWEQKTLGDYALYPVENDVDIAVTRQHVYELANKGDPENQLSLLLICHGRGHGIPTMFGNVLNMDEINAKHKWRYHTVTIDLPVDASYPVDPKPDYYINITTEDIREHKWMEEHFNMLVEVGCPPNVMFDFKNNGDINFDTQGFRNMLWATKVGGKIYFIPSIFVPSNTATTHKETMLSREAVETLVKNINIWFGNDKPIIKLLVHDEHKTVFEKIARYEEMYGGTSSYHNKYVKYKTKYLALKNKI